MAYPPFRLRTVIEDDLFCERLRQVEPNPVKADECIDGVKVRLCNEPDSGERIGVRIWVTFIRKTTLSRGLAVYYVFDENSVTLLDLRPVEEDDDW